MASPGQGMIYDAKSRAQAVHTRTRLEQCWTLDVNWELYPNQLHTVSFIKATDFFCITRSVNRTCTYIGCFTRP